MNGDVWRCHACETFNSGDLCDVCDAPRPSRGSRTLDPVNAEEASRRDRRKVHPAIFVVLVLVVGIFVFQWLTSSSEHTARPTTSVATKPTTAALQPHTATASTRAGVTVATTAATGELREDEVQTPLPTRSDIAAASRTPPTLASTLESRSTTSVVTNPTATAEPMPSPASSLDPSLDLTALLPIESEVPVDLPDRTQGMKTLTEVARGYDQPERIQQQLASLGIQDAAYLIARNDSQSQALAVTLYRFDSSDHAEIALPEVAADAMSARVSDATDQTTGDLVQACGLELPSSIGVETAKIRFGKSTISPTIAFSQTVLQQGSVVAVIEWWEPAGRSICNQFEVPLAAATSILRSFQREEAGP